MSGLKLIVTKAGRAALPNQDHTGTQAVTISHVGVTATAFVAHDELAALPGELKRLSTISGAAVAPDTMHLMIRDDSSDSYSMRGFGLYLADGTLFAAYGQEGVILEKSAQALMLLATDTVFADIDAASIQFGDADFLNPPATTEVAGVTQYATDAGALLGAADNRSITARALKYVLDSRFGAGAPSSFVKPLFAMTTALAIRAALELGNAALKNEGHGNGLNADLLDGRHASEFSDSAHTHSIAGVTGLQAALDSKQPAGSYAAASHTHTIAQVTGLQTALDGKASSSHTHSIAGVTGLQAALDSKQPAGSYAAASHTHTIAQVTGLQTALDGKAPLASPAFTGAPKVPTAATSTNNTTAASTAFVHAAIAAALANYLPKNNPTFTGTMTGPAYNKAP